MNIKNIEVIKTEDRIGIKVTFEDNQNILVDWPKKENSREWLSRMFVNLSEQLFAEELT